MSFLPEPTFSFTLPSLHDDTTLACRLYLPNHQENNNDKKGAILAHPYATLGGCYDDPVVNVVGSEILNQGLILMTFNFRGAGKSKGRTSWTGKPEIVDYMTVAGFLIQYLNQLEATTRIDDSNQICIVLGGYSYGSLIASRLPEIPLILSPFSSQAPSPTAQEIMVTAQDLANQSNRRLKRAELGGQKRESAELMGTDPNDSHTRLKDEVPQIIQDGQIKAVRTSKSSIEFSSKLVIGSAPLSQIPISVSYLLISPLLPPISVLISLPLGNHSDSEDHFRKFREKPSFAIWGENDNFTSSAKLRHWAEDLNKANDTFLWIEVKGASHFWRERGVVEHLTSKVGEFVRLVTSGTTTLQKAVIS